MLSKKEIKDIQSLGLKKCREETGLFVAEGPKIVTELLTEVPGQVKQLLAVPEWADKHSSLVKDIPLQVVSPDELQRASGLKTANLVLATVKQFPSREPVVQNSVCLYLDAIQDPGNFGTIIRIADWFGIKYLLCAPGCVEVYNPKVVQAAMGGHLRVNIFEGDIMPMLRQTTMPICM